MKIINQVVETIKDDEVQDNHHSFREEIKPNLKVSKKTVFVKESIEKNEKEFFDKQKQKENFEKEKAIDRQKEREKEKETEKLILIDNEKLKLKPLEKEKDIFINLDYKVKKDIIQETTLSNFDQNQNNCSNNLNTQINNKLKNNNQNFVNNNPQMSNIFSQSNIINANKKENNLFQNENPNIIDFSNKNNQEEVINLKAKSGIQRMSFNQNDEIININNVLIDTKLNIKFVSNLSNNLNDQGINTNNPAKQQTNNNIFYNLSKNFSAEQLLIKDFPKEQENKNNDIFLEKDSSLKRKFMSEANLMISPEKNMIKDEKPSTVISAKFKNFDLINEDFEDLFNDKTEVVENAGTDLNKLGIPKSMKKKKKNPIIDDVKYQDLNTRENFNFYSSSVFSKNSNKK